MTKRAKQYPLVDILKFISALMIIAIHTQPFLEYQDSILYYPYAYMKCFSIPFFFVSSSFLFFSKFLLLEINEQKKYYVKWIKRIGGLYLVYSLLNAVISIIFDGLDFFENIYGIELLEYILLGKNNGYLWFVAALIISISIIVLLNTINKKFFANVIIVILFSISFVLMIIMQFYYKFFENCDIVISYYSYFDNVRNFISGFFYVYLGIIVVYIDKRKNSIKKIFYIVTPVIFFCSCLEYYYVVIKNIYKEEFSTFLISFVVILVMLISANVSFKCDKSSIFRRVSNVMYFQQRYVILLVSVLVKLGVTIFANNIVQFLAVVGITILLTVLYDKLRKTRFERVVKYLY